MHPPKLDGFHEVRDQAIDIREGIGTFHAIAVAMIALPPLVVEADHSCAIDDIDKALFETMARRGHWRRDAPDHEFREVLEAEDDATSDQELRNHVGMMEHDHPIGNFESQSSMELRPTPLQKTSPLKTDPGRAIHPFHLDHEMGVAPCPTIPAGW